MILWLLGGVAIVAGLLLLGVYWVGMTAQRLGNPKWM